MRSLLQLFLFIVLLVATCSIASAQIMIRCDSIEFSPELPVKAFEKGTSLTLRCRIIVQEAPNDTSMTVRLQVLRGGRQILSADDTVAVDAPDDTVWVTYAAPVTDTITKISGSYQARVTARVGAVTGTTSTPFIVRALHDIAPNRIQEPLDGMFDEGDSVAVVVRFYNLGTSVERDVKVRVTFALGPNGSIQFNDTAVIAGDLAPMEYRDITFRKYLMTIPGRGEISICSMLTGDSITTNDCLNRLSIQVIRSSDLAVAPVTGALHLPIPDSRQSLVDSIPVRVEFRKNGTTDAAGVPVQVTIRNANDAVLYNRNTTVNLVGTQSTTADLAHFKAPERGVYTVRAVIQGLDRSPANDTLEWSFRVVQFAGLAAIDPAQGYNEPVPNSKIQRGVPAIVQLTFSNFSAALLDTVPIVVQIRNSAGTIVYDQSRSATGVAPDSAVFIQQLPNFTPTVNGRYCVTAWVNYADDTIRTDDTSRWCFDVIGTGSVDSWQSGHAGYSLAVLPNPVRDDAVLRYRVPEGVRWRSVLYDAAGREVRELCGDQTGGEGELDIALDGLPSGLYTIVLESSKGVRIVAPVVVRR